MDTEQKDVKETSSTPETEPKDNVDPKEPELDDKTKNFAELRKQKEQAERERDEALRRLSEKEQKDSSLTVKTDPDDDEKVPKVIFDRDLREATIQWRGTNNPSPEEWSQIRDKVSLKGTETLSEIKAKIDEVYQALPSVRTRRDKELIEKGKRMAMGEFNDEELDIGGGGDVDLGGETEPRFTSREKSFLDRFGVKPEARKKINKDSDPSQETIGPSPTRKFFQL